MALGAGSYKSSDGGGAIGTLPPPREQSVFTDPLRLPEASPGAFGAGIGRAAQGVGQEIMGASDRIAAVAQQAQTRTQDAQVMGAYRGFSDWVRNSIYDPNTGPLAAQGADAATHAQTYSQDLLKKQNEFRDSLPPGAQPAFDRLAFHLTDNTADTISKHVFSETIQYREAQLKGLTEGIQLDVGSVASDPKKADELIKAGETAILSNGNGKPIEQIDVERRQFRSGARLQQFQQMLTVDPAAATRFLQAHRGEFVGQDVIEADKALVVPMRKVLGDQLFRQGLPSVSAGVRQLGGAVQSVESGGSGPNAISPSGAVGPMQVMPGTATQVAKDMGLTDFPFGGSDADKTRYILGLPDKGKSLGERYLQQNLIRYGGDVEAALVAYNAGPGVADKWLKAGRDPSVLPDETRAYVPKVMSQWRGDSGAQVQGGGEAKQFLAPMVRKDLAATSPRALTGMSDVLAVRLARMVQAMPPGVRVGFGINSGYRSSQRQGELFDAAVRKYGSPEAARQWVAPPGHSQHNMGRAADLRNDNPQTVAWMHAHAGEFGLTFPLRNENWHIEPVGARKPGPTVTDANVRQAFPGTAAQPDAAVPAQEFDIQTTPTGLAPSFADGHVQVAPGSVTAADSVAPGPQWATVHPATIDAAAVDARVEEIAGIYGPEIADIVQRKYNAEITRQNAQEGAAKRTNEETAFKLAWSGQGPENWPQDVLATLGPGKVNAFDKLAEKRRGGDDKTDEAVLYRLKMLPPEQLRDVNLMDYAHQLSQADFKGLIDDQKAALKPNNAATAGMQTRQEIVAGAIAGMGLHDTPDHPTEAVKAQAFAARVDQEINAVQARTGKPADALEIQAIADRLVLQDKSPAGFFSWRGMIGGGEAPRLYQETPEQAATFKAAESVDDIPPQHMQALSAQYRQDFQGKMPKPEDAVALYNKAVLAASGVTLDAPPDFIAEITKQVGRALPADDLNRAYSDWLRRYVP